MFVSYVLDKMYGSSTVSQQDTIMRYGNVGYVWERSDGAGV